MKTADIVFSFPLKNFTVPSGVREKLFEQFITIYTQHNNLFSVLGVKGSRFTLNCSYFGQIAKHYTWDKTRPDRSYGIHKAQSFIRHRFQYTDAETYRFRYTLQQKTDWMYSNNTTVVVQGTYKCICSYHKFYFSFDVY